MIGDNTKPFFRHMGQPATLDGRPVVVIFDAESSNIFDTRAQGKKMTATLSTVDAGNAKKGSVLVLGTATYQVGVPQLIGDGKLTKLPLGE